MSEQKEFQRYPDKPEKQDSKNFKFPKIQRFSSRSYHKQMKSNTKLPTLKSQTQIQSSQTSTQRRSIEQDDFVDHISKRLRYITEQQNIMQIGQSEESDGDGFQQKIKENKQIIKEAKRRNLQIKNQNQNKNLIKKYSKKVKYQGYQKKNRQQKQTSGCKHIKKKQPLYNTTNKHPHNELKDFQREIPKSSIVLKQINNSNISEFKEVKSKDQITSFHKILPTQFNSYRQQLAVSNKKINKQLSQQRLDPLQKNQHLFEVIHKYLQNPKKLQIQANNQKVLKQILYLQQQLRQCQLNKNKNTIDSQNKPKYLKAQLQKQNIQKIITYSQWRKIGVSNCNLINQISTFDKQIDRIGHYLQRNQKSLQKYIQNQKLLIDVQISRKQGSKERYKSCQTQNSI